MNIVTIQLTQSDDALYLRLADALSEKIQNGEIIEGEALPPVRKLAEKLNLSNSTVIAAYRHLENLNLVYSKRGSGTYVLPRSSVIIVDDAGREVLPQYDNIYIPDDSINLAGSTPGPDMFPTEEFKLAVNKVLDTDGGSAFTYQESEGFEGLRTEIAAYANESLASNLYKAEDILITSGAQQAIDLIAKVLIRPGDVVLVENPTYIGAGSNFKARGGKIIGVPMEDDGLNMDVLKYYIKRYKPRFLYTMPLYHTPTGAVMSFDKRKELLDLSQRYDFYIIEEDVASDISLGGERILPLKSQDASGRVIYVKSFSKIFMPGIRTGFIIAPQEISRGIADVKYITDISASGLIQRSLCVYFQSGFWRSHLSVIEKTYKTRMETAYKIISDWESKGVKIQKPKGGFGFWLKLPERIKDYEMHESCLSNKVLIAKGSTFYVSPMHEYDRYIRISFAASGTGEVEKGLNTAGKILDALLVRKYKRTHFRF